jgi:hypothetical protein
MRRPETPFVEQDSAGQAALYMAMELSNRQWRLAFTDRRHNPRRVTAAARDLVALREQIGQAKSRFSLPESTPLCSCYEAGRDGFWLHRCLAWVRMQRSTDADDWRCEGVILPAGASPVRVRVPVIRRSIGRGLEIPASPARRPGGRASAPALLVGSG